MSLFDELFADILGESRPKSPKVAPKSPAESGSTMRVIAQSPESPALGDEIVAPMGAGHGLLTSYGAGYRHPDGRIETGQPDPMPLPALEWPADLDALLRRVSTFYEWSATDRHDFIAWARRSPDGLADARLFLEHEIDKRPTLIKQAGNI